MINKRKKYIAHKSKQLDKITDAHKYTRRLSRVMLYHRLLTDLETAAARKIIEGDGIEMTKRKVRIEEVLVGVDEEFSINLWIESGTLQYADTFYKNNEHWIVVEVESK